MTRTAHPPSIDERRAISARIAKRRGQPPQSFRSRPDGTLLTDQPVEQVWCWCGCGEAVSALAEPWPCSIEAAGPPPGYQPAPNPPAVAEPETETW